MEPQSGIKTWQWVVTVIVVIVLIIIGIMVFGNKKSAPSTSDTDTNATSTAMAGANSIVISDQFPGNIVNISSVNAEKPIWIAIHKDNSGQPGEIIGYARFGSGMSTGRITLTQPTIDGQTYYAMIHSDDGDNKFDAVKDAPLKDANGNVVMRPFRASSTANAQIKG